MFYACKINTSRVLRVFISYDLETSNDNTIKNLKKFNHGCEESKYNYREPVYICILRENKDVLSVVALTVCLNFWVLSDY